MYYNYHSNKELMNILDNINIIVDLPINKHWKSMLLQLI